MITKVTCYPASTQPERPVLVWRPKIATSSTRNIRHQPCNLDSCGADAHIFFIAAKRNIPVPDEAAHCHNITVCGLAVGQYVVQHSCATDRSVCCNHVVAQPVMGQKSAFAGCSAGLRDYQGVMSYMRGVDNVSGPNMVDFVACQQLSSRCLQVLVVKMCCFCWAFLGSNVSHVCAQSVCSSACLAG